MYIMGYGPFHTIHTYGTRYEYNEYNAFIFV